MPQFEYSARTALIVVDVQNDFTHPAGTLFRPGREAVVPAVNTEIQLALAKRALIIYTQDWHPNASLEHFRRHSAHCVADSWGAELNEALDIVGTVIRKGMANDLDVDGYSGFSQPQMRLALKEHGVENVVVVGIALQACVKATALDAVKDGYATYVLRRATASETLNIRDRRAVIRELKAAGIHVE